jgi:threonine dehydrogenase-like Zn-dependent dehydrogenase
MQARTNRLGKVIEAGVVGFETRSLGSTPAGKVRISVVSSSICGSDLHIFKGKHPSVALPAAIGHELAGEVVALGNGVTSLSLGDRLTVEPVGCT